MVAVRYKRCAGANEDANQLFESAKETSSWRLLNMAAACWKLAVAPAISTRCRHCNVQNNTFAFTNCDYSQWSEAIGAATAAMIYRSATETDGIFLIYFGRIKPAYANE